MKFQHRKVVKTFLMEGYSLINKLETLGKKFVKMNIYGSHLYRRRCRWVPQKKEENHEVIEQFDHLVEQLHVIS